MAAQSMAVSVGRLASLRSQLNDMYASQLTDLDSREASGEDVARDRAKVLTGYVHDLNEQVEMLVHLLRRAEAGMAAAAGLGVQTTRPRPGVVATPGRTPTGFMDLPPARPNGRPVGYSSVGEYYSSPRRSSATSALEQRALQQHPQQHHEDQQQHQQQQQEMHNIGLESSKSQQLIHQHQHQQEAPGSSCSRCSSQQSPLPDPHGPPPWKMEDRLTYQMQKAKAEIRHINSKLAMLAQNSPDEL